jgi:hypothetical protein
MEQKKYTEASLMYTSWVLMKHTKPFSDADIDKGCIKEELPYLKVKMTLLTHYNVFCCQFLTTQDLHSFDRRTFY